MTVKLPSPFEANTSCLFGSKAVASQSSPMGTVCMTLPVLRSTTASFWLPHEANNTLLLLSIDKPVGSSQEPSGHIPFTFRDAASMTVMALLSALLTYTFPWSSATANSGLPARDVVAVTLSDAASMTLTLWLCPLKTNTDRVGAYY